MAKNRKKFANQRFIRTIDLVLMRRLLDPYQAALQGLDMAVFDADPATVRPALYDFFSGPEENHPDGLVADLHRIAELGDANGLRLLMEQARRRGVGILDEDDETRDEGHEDPKHIALRMFLDERELFDAAADTLSYTTLSSYSEFAGLDEGVEVALSEASCAAFQTEAAILLVEELRGGYCRVGWYDDDGETNIVVTHGAVLKTTEIIEEGADRVIRLREAEHAVLSYDPASGRLKIGGFAKAGRADLAEILAATMLKRPGFFSAPDAQNLYTLDHVERDGFAFKFEHAFDANIRRVIITAVQVDRIGVDPRSGKTRTMWSHTVRDSRDNALARMGETTRGISFGSDWQINHIIIGVDIDVGEKRPVRVTIKLKPPSLAVFKRHRFEARIMTLLRRNGFVHDREPDRAAAAAE